jgi:hypothetical protein
MAVGFRIKWFGLSQRELQDVYQVARQFPFAMSRALNDTALEFQRVQREHQEKAFEFRGGEAFFKRAVKYPRSLRPSSKNLKLEATVIIDASVPDRDGNRGDRTDIFTRQEEGQTRFPQVGNKALAIPTEDVQRTSRGIIKKRDRPKSLRGKRDFVRPLKSGKLGLFQRIGSRQKAFVKTSVGKGSKIPLGNDPNVRFLYVLQKRAQIDEALEFYENAERVWKSGFFDRAYRKRLKEAFATARR